MNLTDKKSVIEFLQTHGLFTKKRFGQNFLINAGILKNIVNAANIKSTDHVIEIGPGLGVLTEELIKKAKKITSIELDNHLIPLLKTRFSDQKNFELLHMDALKFTPPKTPYKIVANIPYNITSPLLNHFLQAKNKPTSMTILVQKEVADKITQHLHSKKPKHSILSLQVALFADAKMISRVPAGNFFPAPKVESAILQITPRKNLISNAQALQILTLAKRAFTHKRKKLSHTFKNLPPEIDPNLRPEDLSPQEWGLISDNEGLLS
ncbi:MAG: 16S rRNA (adenine(1518)-N(6)/adenine(1519)-N(6))-dimethyltransferase RsmA [Candidatus Gracilibacteria bacterium]